MPGPNLEQEVGRFVEDLYLLLPYEQMLLNSIAALCPGVGNRSNGNSMLTFCCQLAREKEYI